MSTVDVVDLDNIARSGHVSDADVLAMRQAFYGDGRIDLREAEKLLLIAQRCSGQSDAWPSLFVEALTDYLVNQAEPFGYICEHQTEWLITHMLRDGRIASHTELELLIKLLETAVEAPRSLVMFTLNAIKTAVLEGDSALLGDAKLTPGVIGEAEVDLIRRVLYAAGGASNVWISRDEAEVLFDLNDASAGQDNHWSWSDLFAKAIVNHVMAANNYQPISRAEALRMHNALQEPSGGMASFMSKMFSGEITGAIRQYNAFHADDWQARKLDEMETNIAEAEVVTGAEAAWLADRIGRNGQLDDTETAVLRLIRDECPDIQAGLAPLLEQLSAFNRNRNDPD